MIIRSYVPSSLRPLSRLSRPSSLVSNMPLKAKITNPAFTAAQSTQASPYVPDLSPQPEDEPDDVIFGNVYNARTIELNRPKKLNSLNGSMARKIIPRLQEYAKSSLASLVIISGAGPKAFCAGGDVAALALLNQREGDSGRAKSTAFFALEYYLDHLIATYQKPYVAYMDGITMGGGVGLSVHAPIRIATERTVFAMPETTIGFFPDVGGSFFLPRLDGQLGRYLALTSEQVRGVNALYAGIATHYIDSTTLPSLTARLGELEFKDYEPFEDRLRTIDATIEEFHSGLPHDEPPLYVGPLREAIDRCFSHEKVEGIMSALFALKTDTSMPESIREWASKALSQMTARSPTSLKVTMKQLNLGFRWDITHTFEREYALAQKFMTSGRTPDFDEGVTARLINKPPTTPQWKYKLGEVDDRFVDQLFAYSRDRALGFDASNAYFEYPYRGILGLPSERELEERIKRGDGVDATRLMADVMRERRGKEGVRAKVEEIIRRKCTGGKGRDPLRWKD